MNSRTRAILRNLLRVLAVALLVSLILVLSLPFTARGTALLLDLADEFTPLKIEYGGGSLAGKLQLDRLELVLGRVELRVEAIDTQLSRDCLWRSRICLQQLQVASFDLQVAAIEGGEAEQIAMPGVFPDPPAFRFPLPVDVAALTLGHGRVAWPGGQWQQGQSVASLTLEGETILVNSAEFADGRLLLSAPSEEPKPEAPIELPRVDLPVSLDIQALTLLQPGWDAYGNRQELSQLQLRGNWRGTEITIHRLDVDGAELGRLGLAGNIQLDRQWPLNLGLELLTGEAPLPALFQQRAVDATLGGNLAELAVVASMTGDPALRWQGEFDVLDRELPFSLHLSARPEQPLPVSSLVALPPAFGDLVLDAPVDASLDGSLKQFGFELSAGASGIGYQEMALFLKGVQSEGLLQVEELTLGDSSGSNSLNASGKLEFGEYQGLVANIGSTGFDLPELEGQLTGRLQGDLQIQGRQDQAGWNLSVAAQELQGEVNELPAMASGLLNLDSRRRLSGSDFSADINGARLRLQARQGDQRGQVEIDVNDLGRWLEDARGAFHARATLAADLSELDLNGTLGDFAWQGVTSSGGTLRAAFSLQEPHPLSLDIALADVDVADWSLASLRLALKGDSNKHQLTVSSQGDFAGKLVVEGALEGDDWQGRLLPTRWKTPFDEWQLQQSVPLAWQAADAQLLVAAHCWRDSQSSLCPGELLLGTTGSGSFEGRGGLGRLAAILPDDLELDGEARLQGQARWSPDAGLIFEAEASGGPIDIQRDFGGGEFSSARWQQVSAAIQGEGGAWQLTTRALMDSGQLLSLALSSPAGSEEIAGELLAESVPLNLLSPMLLQVSDLEGDIDGRLRLAGTLAAPLAFGDMKITGGKAALLGNPTNLEQLEVNLNARGNRAELVGTALLGGGELALAGEVLSGDDPHIELSIIGGRHTVSYPPSTNLVISEDLQLLARPDELFVTGEVRVHEGKLLQEQLPAGSVGLSADIIEVDYQGLPIAEDRAFKTNLDVWLRVEEKFRIVGSGLDATVGGDLQIRQRPPRPLQLFGNLNIVGGQLVAYNQTLRIQRGSIGFAGDPQNPGLNVRAQREISRDNVVVGVALSGPLDDPRLEVYSEPAMSETEALSYLARGRGLDSGAAADSTAMALSMGSTLLNQSGVFTGLERIPGLRDITVGAEGSADDTAATVSGYIGDRIFISYGIGIYEPINVLVARLYLQTRLWLEVVSRLENSVDIYYSFDIE